jgi:hypothetical protein
MDVDDLTLIGTLQQVNEMKKLLFSKYDLKDLGPLKCIIGIEVIQTQNATFLHQSNYIKDILIKFNMINSKPAPTPMVKSTYSEDNTPFQDTKLYLSAVGSLNYISTSTRPDISFTVNTVSRKMSNPNHEDWKKVKRIFRYLKGSINLKLKYTNNTTKLIGYSDAEFAGDPTDRKSTGGYIFMKNGGAIFWSSKKQSIIALSSMESELIALTEAIKESLHIRQLLANFKVEYQPVIYEDNQSTIKFSQQHVTNPRSKHIDVRYLFIREYVKSKEVIILYCPSEDMIADIFTKALNINKHSQFTNLSGLCDDKL